METYDLICIGSGPAGEKAATQASYYGYSVAIVEARPQPGGAMVNTGTIPSKALRETALLCSALNRRLIPGMSLEIDRMLSVPRFMARRHLIEQQEHDRIESSFDRHGIHVHVGHGRLVDANIVEVEVPDGSRHCICGKHILIATGSSPLQPDNVPFDQPNVVDADGVLELQQLPESMIVVGGGVIGCEYASIFAEINVQVTLVHPRNEIMSFIDAECRSRLVRSMQDRGVDFLLNESVSTVMSDSTTVTVCLESGKQITASALLWAAGRSSNTQDIGLETVGVKTSGRGLIEVNAHYQTNIPSIYAAGDVIGFPALAATSMEQGRIAACNMFGIHFKEKLAGTMPMGIYTIPAVSMVGLSEDEAIEKKIDIVVGRAVYRLNARGRMLGDDQGLIKCIFDRDSKALLGATIVGEDATELVHLAQCLITQELGIDYLIDACFNYPSLCEMYKYTAYDALQTLAKDDQSKAA